jgi:hypothetical protein
MGAARYALLEEVANSTGGGDRYCDVILMELWKSDGHRWHGFEIKASRADWLNELKDPSKADAFKRYMDRWWLVVGDASIVKEGELPPGWGLLVPTVSRTLRIARQPAPLTPEPWPRAFMAAIVRRVVEQSVDAERLADAEQRGRVDGWHLAMQADQSVDTHRKSLKRLRDEMQFVLDRVKSTLRGAAPHE